ncbi:septal ring lytic transglycosylase RlpA family protein [Pseudomonas sp. BMS12]|uniref:septal ring lytic transglycosylase RlpA family protein n=1 Tax=Pseudomonas sp. BMS12 TaxID=1796033 RepID=UPI00083A2709|nr:septal ring lytic transglycosylase RlpA family protein [Pseudomonas sp. BMS12]
MRRFLLPLAALLLTGCASQGQIDPHGYRDEGQASWYGAQHQGKPTASGERFDQNALTAAHRQLPFGTRVRVTHLGNGRQVTVRINDRGPFAKGRIIDLSRRAAEQLGMLRQGVAPVRIEALDD